MAERTLRGSRLGAVSYETDRNAELAPRLEREYSCPKGHTFSVPFAADAEIPPTWDCRSDGATATLIDDSQSSEEKQVKPPRTHWDMLLERRSTEELEEVLNERLQHLRKRRGEVPSPDAE